MTGGTTEAGRKTYSLGFRSLIEVWGLKFERNDSPAGSRALVLHKGNFKIFNFWGSELLMESDSKSSKTQPNSGTQAPFRPPATATDENIE